MPEEIYTRTGQHVADQVKRLFGDPDGRQIVDADILTWINIAQQEVASQNAVLHNAVTADIVAGQGTYTYPSAIVQYIEALHLNNRPLKGLTFLEAQGYILAQNDGTLTPEVSEGLPQIWYERNGEITIWPVPTAAAANGLKLYYIERPIDLTALGDALQLPDRYFQRIVDNVLARAYQLDENWEAANYKQQEYQLGMSMLNLQERVAQSGVYPSPYTRPEDA